VHATLRAGLSLEATAHLRPLVDEFGKPLSDPSHLKREFIPLILKNERAKVQAELAGQSVSLEFDGTTRMGEILAFVARFCSEDFVLHHRLIELTTLQHHGNGQTLAFALTSVLVSYVIPPHLVVSVARDSASVNGVAVENLRMSLVHSSDILCISHTLDNCGKHFKFENVNEFMNGWLIMCHSSRARLEWNKLTGAMPKSFSPTRWWSKAEVQNSIFEHFDKIKDFLEALERNDICERSVRNMLGTYSKDPLQLELAFAALQDASIPFIQATYQLEGNQLEILLAHRWLTRISNFGNSLQELKEQLGKLADLEVRLADCSSNSERVKVKKDVSDLSKEINRDLLPSVNAVVKKHAECKVGMPISKVFPDGFGRYHGRVVEINKIIEDEMCCRVLYSDGDSEDMSYANAIDHYEAHCDGRFIASLDSIIPAFKYLEDRLTDNCRSLAHGCFEIHRLFRCSPRSLFPSALCLTLSIASYRIYPGWHKLLTRVRPGASTLLPSSTKCIRSQLSRALTEATCWGA
jgi:hypothetical protein